MVKITILHDYDKQKISFIGFKKVSISLISILTLILYHWCKFPSSGYSSISRDTLISINPNMKCSFFI